MNARTVIAVIALLFFFVPLGLRAAGVTARPFENRPLATAPKLSQGWDALDQSTRFLVDRLPLREQAVRADAWLSTNVFDTRPTAGRATGRDSAGLPFTAPQPAAKPPAAAAAAPPPGDKAVVGKQGWLFLDGELVRTCNLFVAWPEAMKRWERMASTIRRSGRRVLVVFPPDKSTIYPEHLPGTFAQRDCLAPGKRATWRAIESATDPAIFGLRKMMLAVKRQPPDEAYYRKDTHWNTKGGTIAVGAVLDHLGGPVRMGADEIVKRRADYNGDLSTLNGTPETDRAPAWSIRRRPSAAQRPGRTLFVYDSYGTAMQDALTPYFRSLTLLQWYNTPPAAIIAAIKAADTVVLETVEREVNYRASDLGLLTQAFFGQLQRALPRQSR
jgi:alginate O-acetyltransferase complex protein AlgJ